MAGPYTHKERLAYVGAIEETTEGDYEVILLGDAGATMIEPPTWSIEGRLYERRPSKEAFSTLPALLGGQSGTITAKFELAGAGNLHSTVPAWSPLLCAAGWQVEASEAVTTAAKPANAIPGELFTQAVTGATAYFITSISDTGPVIFGPISPIPHAEDNANVWTGAVSGATFTPTSVGTPYGVVHRPNSLSPSYTVGVFYPYFDGTDTTCVTLKGARGSWAISANLGESVIVTCTYTGVWHDMMDTPHLARVEDQYAGLVFLGADFFSMNQTAAIGAPAGMLCFNNWTMEGNTEIALRDCANAAGGYKSAMITGRNITGGYNPEMLEVVGAGYDFSGDFDTQVQNVLQWKLGTVAGDKVTFGAGNVRYRGMSASPRSGIMGLDLPFGVHRVGVTEDTEVLILTH